MDGLRKEYNILDGCIFAEKYSEMEKHHVQMMRDKKLFIEEENCMKNYAHAFGSALPMQLTIQRNMLAQHMRPQAGLPVSYLGLEVHMNRLNKIDYEDFLNVEQPTLEKHDAHSLFLQNF